jgi:hypothetical protein
MSSKQHTEEVETMFTRILKTLTVVLALVLVIPGTALAMKMSDGSAFSSQSSKPIVSEKTAGLYQVGQRALPAVIVSEKTAGLQQPTTPEPTVVASNGSDFNWGDAGIGAGIVAAGILVGLGGALAVRHRHDPLAH